MEAVTQRVQGRGKMGTGRARVASSHCDALPAPVFWRTVCGTTRATLIKNMFFSHVRGCACLTFDRLRCACVAPFAAWAAWTANGGQGSSAKKKKNDKKSTTCRRSMPGTRVGLTEQSGNSRKGRSIFAETLPLAPDMSQYRLKMVHVSLSRLGPTTQTEQPFSLLGFRRATSLHITMFLAFLEEEGGGRGGTNGAQKRRDAALRLERWVFAQKYFPKYTNNAPNEKSKRWPKKDHLGGSHEQKQEWWQSRPRFGIGSAEMRPQRPLPTSVRPCLRCGSRRAARKRELLAQSLSFAAWC